MPFQCGSSFENRARGDRVDPYAPPRASVYRDRSAIITFLRGERNDLIKPVGVRPFDPAAPDDLDAGDRRAERSWCPSAAGRAVTSGRERRSRGGQARGTGFHRAARTRCGPLLPPCLLARRRPSHGMLPSRYSLEPRRARPRARSFLVSSSSCSYPSLAPPPSYPYSRRTFGPIHAVVMRYTYRGTA